MFWSPCQVDRADVTVELWNPLGELYLMRKPFVQRKTTDPGGVISSLTFRRAKSSATRIPTFPQCCWKAGNMSTRLACIVQAKKMTSNWQWARPMEGQSSRGKGSCVDTWRLSPWTTVRPLAGTWSYPFLWNYTFTDHTSPEISIF